MRRKTIILCTACATILIFLFIVPVFLRFQYGSLKKQADNLCVNAVGLSRKEVFETARKLGLKKGDRDQGSQEGLVSWSGIKMPDYEVFWAGFEFPVPNLNCCFVEFEGDQVVKAKATYTDGEYCSWYLEDFLEEKGQ